MAQQGTYTCNLISIIRKLDRPSPEPNIVSVLAGEANDHGPGQQEHQVRTIGVDKRGVEGWLSPRWGNSVSNPEQMRTTRAAHNSLGYDSNRCSVLGMISTL